MTNAFKLPDLQNITSESDPDFEKNATSAERKAVEISVQSSGITGDLKDQKWGRKSYTAQEDRRLGSLQMEKKTEDSELSKVNGEIRAKFKIEVTFTMGRTTQGPNKLGIQLWESGKHFHGGGDELMYWCQDNREGENSGCWAPISGSNIVGEVAYCPNCKRTVASELLTNMKIGNVSTRKLAEECSKLFRQLGSNADLYLKYHKTDIHYIAMEKSKGKKTADRLKGMHIYPLKNLLKDTAFGADLTKRFYAFLTS